MNYENILYEKNSHIVSITLNRPKRLNAINPPTQVELWHALNYFQNDKDAWGHRQRHTSSVGKGELADSRNWVEK